MKDYSTFDDLEELSGTLSPSVKETNKEGVRFYRDWKGAKYTGLGTLNRVEDINELPTPRHWMQ